MRDGNVALSVARAGQIVYAFDPDDMMTADEKLSRDGPQESKGME